MDKKREVLRSLADNPMLLGAVYELFQEKFNKDSDVSYGALDNARLGEIMRARFDGLKKVEEVFREIALCKSSEERREIINPAR